MGQLTDKALAVSQTYRAAATALIDQARQLRDDGKITPAEYDVVFRRFLQILQQAATVLDEASHNESLGLDREMGPIVDATERLKEAYENVQTVQEVLDISLSLLVAVGSVALAVADPTHVSAAAAAGAVLSATETVLKHAK